MHWTVEQILALAPDAKSAKAGAQLAAPQKWAGLGQNKQAIWGKCRGSGKKPYQTQIDLTELTFKCSCPSRKFPCKHALALFLLSVQHSDKFTQSAPPDWVSAWLKARARQAQQRARKAEQQSQVSDREAQARRAAKREEKVAAGLEELQLWLSDLAREGLAAAREKPRQFWQNPAARLVDAQAPGLANRIQRLADTAYADDHWHEKLVEQLGSLYLLLAGYQRLETLPDLTQIDIRTQVGWTQNQEAGQGVPLTPHFDQGWQLLAVSGGQPISIFGEWDGYHFWPLSVFANERFVAGFEAEPF